MSLLGADMRDEIKGKKKDKSDGDLYRGARSSVTFKDADQQQPLDITVWTDEKNKVVGVELNGYLLPMQIQKASKEKIAEINRVYRLWRVALIHGIRLLIPRG